ncbi:MAG: CYTH domain-containing protein [Candidatus Aenigmarchaeota archaeon]|nr:CYTH domain-containing protein [Candidatus Aenigmarchaeota archaeon]
MIKFEKEIEIKIVVDEDILNKIKFIKLTPYEEIDEYFTTKKMLDDHTFLRIRKKKGKIVLQLKNITVRSEDTKDCYEADELHMELNQEQYEKMRKMFLVTFPHSFIVSKIRNKGIFNECEICLDEVKDLGRFLEIEGPKEKILEICDKLKLDMNKRDQGDGYAIMIAKKEGLL